MLNLIQKFEDITENIDSFCEIDSDLADDEHIRVFNKNGSISYFEYDELVFLFRNELGFISKMKYESYEIETDDGFCFLIHDKDDQSFSYYENYEFVLSFEFSDGDVLRIS